jgi:hypothetical protein
MQTKRRTKVATIIIAALGLPALLLIFGVPIFANLFGVSGLSCPYRQG